MFWWGSVESKHVVCESCPVALLVSKCAVDRRHSRCQSLERVVSLSHSNLPLKTTQSKRASCFLNCVIKSALKEHIVALSTPFHSSALLTLLYPSRTLAGFTCPSYLGYSQYWVQYCFKLKFNGSFFAIV